MFENNLVPDLTTSKGANHLTHAGNLKHISCGIAEDAYETINMEFFG